MNWNLTNNVDDFHQWTLTGHEENVDFRYHKQARSIRLNTDEKRLFFLERKGILQSKILLKTEYSVVIGESYFGKNRLSGLLTYEGRRHTFKFGPEGLSIFDSNKENVFNFEINHGSHPHLFEFSALLFASVIVTQKYLSKPQRVPTR
jgi:hypothetical protein